MAINNDFLSDELEALMKEAEQELAEDEKVVQEEVKEVEPQATAKEVESDQREKINLGPKEKPKKEDSATDINITEKDDGQFSLFDFGTSVTTEEIATSIPKKEKSSTEKGKPKSEKASTKSATAPAKKVSTTSAKRKIDPATFTVNDKWTIHWAAQSWQLHDFVDVTILPEEGLSLEKLRQAMESEFFELTKARTHWDVDEDKKRVFPDVYGTAKGGF